MTPHQAKLRTLNRVRHYLIRYKDNSFNVYRITGTAVYRWSSFSCFWAETIARAEDVINGPDTETLSFCEAQAWTAAKDRTFHIRRMATVYD